MLNYIAQLEKTRKINNINTQIRIYNQENRESPLTEIEINWINLLQKIPFNYELLHSPQFTPLREIVSSWHLCNARDINGKTSLESKLNYELSCGPHSIINFMKARWPLFFTRKAYDIGTPNQLKPLLKNLLMGTLSEQDVTAHPFVKPIAKRIIPLHVKGNLSYRQNPYHRNFVNFCSLFPIIQDIVDNSDIAGYIMQYIPSDFENIYDDHKTYVPNRRLLSVQEDARFEEIEEEEMDTRED